MEGHNNGNGQVSLKGLSGVSHTDSNGVIDREQEERNINAEIEANMGILQEEIWRDLTKKTRAKVSVSPSLYSLSLLLTVINTFALLLFLLYTHLHSRMLKSNPNCLLVTAQFYSAHSST